MLIVSQLGYFLEQWILNFIMYQNHVEGLLKLRLLDPTFSSF